MVSVRKVGGSKVLTDKQATALPVPQPVVRSMEQQVQDTIDQHKLWALQQQVDDLEREINETAGLDQSVAKTIPWVHSFLYGPVSCRSARHPGIGTGHELLATVVDPTTPALPRGDNLKVGRGGAFYWCATNVCPYLSWTYTRDPGGVFGGVPVRPVAADIFDSVVDRNGGAQPMMNVSGFAFTRACAANVSFEVDIYDKKRGRSITNGRVPGEMLAGMSYGFNSMGKPSRFEDDTELEPRLYITEIRMTSYLNTDAAFSAASVAAYVNLAFRGYRVLED